MTPTHPIHRREIPATSDTNNNPIAGTFVKSPLGEIVPNMCAVIGLDTSHAHSPVIHIEAIQYQAELFVNP